MQVEKVVIPAVTKVVSPEKVEYHLTCTEDEMYMLRAYLGCSAPKFGAEYDRARTTPMYRAVSDALGQTKEPYRRFRVVDTDDNPITIRLQEIK